MTQGKVAPSNERPLAPARRHSERLPPASHSARDTRFLGETGSMPLHRLQPSSVRDHAVLQEPPELNQQLPGHRHNADFARPRPPASEARLVPPAQSTPGLVPQPPPGQLDSHRPNVPAPRFADALLPTLLAALVGGGREPGRRPHLPAVPKPPPAEELVHVHPGAVWSDRSQPQQLADFLDRLALPV